MKKKVLVIGSGGREQAFAWKMSQSPLVDEVFLYPDPRTPFSSPKIRGIPGNLDDFKDQLKVAKKLRPDLILIGPEGPLEKGLSDSFQKEGLNVLGPDQKAARLESSKSFSKDLMSEFGILTAPYGVYHSYKEAKEGLKEWNEGVAIKADQLAGGKGVFLCYGLEESEKMLFKLMKDPNFSVKDETVVIEKILKGTEISAFALCDGEEFMTLGFARDYKRLKEGDKGPNTGGMGGLSFHSWPEKSLKENIEENVFKKTLQAMKKKGLPFKGFLFAGLMIGPDGEVNVLEFNVRMGDPETQILFPLINEDLYPLFEAAAKGELKAFKQKRPLEERSRVRLKKKSSVHVVLASKGYPVLDKANPRLLDKEVDYPQKLREDQEFIFFSGAKRDDGKTALYNKGGRVLGVTCVEENLKKARKGAYDLVHKISFEGAQWRSDIALN